MKALLLVSDPIAVAIVGFGIVLLGLALLLMGRWPRRRCNQLLALGACVLVGLAVATSLLPDLASCRSALLVLAGMAAAPLLLSVGRCGRLVAAVVAVARDPRAQGSLLLLVVPMIALGWSWQHEPKANPERDAASPANDDSFSSRTQTPYTAQTDRGTHLALYAAVPQGERTTTSAEEVQLIQSRGLALHMIRVDGPDQGSNSHGWTFTAGRYCIDGADVATILQDNDYRVVSDPRAGDLVIYRDASGNIVHSAVVRTVASSGVVLLQSKWSHLGCYLHQPEDYTRAASWTYYRSSRAGHLLHGLPDEVSDTTH